MPATQYGTNTLLDSSCGGKVFFIASDIARSRCYDPDSNCWSSAPWKNKLPFSEGKPLVVKSQICFFVREISSTALWTFSLDSNSLTPLCKWVETANFCAVAMDSYIYVIGGSVRRGCNLPGARTECARFHTKQNEWKKIAPLNEARLNAFGACKNDKIFIAGGSNFDLMMEINILKTCEVYDILMDEWQCIARLTLARSLGSMVLADETLYVFGGRQTRATFRRRGKISDKVECYNPESNEWNVKATVPVNKIPNMKRSFCDNYLNGCTLRVFKGVLTNLESIGESD